ncbi:MAG: hypothetical protein AAGF11_22595 [Myxococcota bacterium]
MTDDGVPSDTVDDPQSDPSEPPIPEGCAYPSAEPDAALFNFIVASEWVDSGCGPSEDPLPPTCERIELRANGDYVWTAVSDYIERDDAGRWNLWTDAERGLVFLDNGSVLDFMPDGDGLRLQGRLLQPGRPLLVEGDAARLSTVTPSYLWCRLVDHPWIKTNDFDKFMDSDAITFSPEGGFEASYRSDECSHGGTWGLLSEEIGTGAPTSPLRTRLSVRSRSDNNACDLRDGGRPASLPSNNEPYVRDELLVLGSASYHPDDGEERGQVLVYDRYGTSLATVVSTERFTPGQEIQLRLEFDNRAHQQFTLHAFTVAQRHDDRSTDALIRVELGAQVLDPGEHFEAQASWTIPVPAADEPLRLEFGTEYATARGDARDAFSLHQLD